MDKWTCWLQLNILNSRGKGENKEMSNRGPILSLWNLYRIEDIVGQAEGQYCHWENSKGSGNCQFRANIVLVKTPCDQEIVSQDQYCPCENSKGSGNCQSTPVLLFDILQDISNCQSGPILLLRKLKMYL